jgi:hypothetical protein
MAKNPKQVQDDPERIVGSTEDEISNPARDEIEEADDYDDDDDDDDSTEDAD